MKFLKIAGYLGFMLALASTTAFAKDGENQLTATVDVASGPGDFDSAVGFTLGFGHELNDGWQVRGDLSYYNFDRDFHGFGVDYGFDYERIPVSGSVRKYFNTPLKELTAYAQAGLEISFDSVEVPWLYYNPITGYEAGTASDDEINIGVPIGGGAEYRLTPEFSVGAALKYHIISDDYGTFNVGASYHF